jgi:2-C-methyl-D-erythritol 4-phosphate cytidylyltransferase
VNMRVSAIVLAAGQGKRLGADKNKVFLEIGSRPLLSYTISAFVQCEKVDEIVVVTANAEQEFVSGLVKDASKPVTIVLGGIRRQDSSLAGVRASKSPIVLIHDGARPFVSRDMITRLVAATKEHRACVPVLPVTDTIRIGELASPISSEAVDRSRLLRMQTPQGFDRKLIIRALSTVKAQITDDAAAVIQMGMPVWAIMGEETNIKVTTRNDLIMAKIIAANRS